MVAKKRLRSLLMSRMWGTMSEKDVILKRIDDILKHATRGRLYNMDRIRIYENERKILIKYRDLGRYITFEEFWQTLADEILEWLTPLEYNDDDLYSRIKRLVDTHPQLRVWDVGLYLYTRKVVFYYRGYSKGFSWDQIMAMDDAELYDSLTSPNSTV